MKPKITPEDITYAEGILLPSGKIFDSERVNFIKNLETIDLQAVPGSGKTTALLAKLLILERYLPLENGAGVLVLSHTNAAVDEIKLKIGRHCPRLFSYPHFIGTIQQFVNRFLAIPCANTLLGFRVNSVDSNLYQSRLLSKFRTIYWNKTYDQPGKWLWARHIGRAKKEASKLNVPEKEICDSLIDAEVKGLYFDFFDSQIKLADGSVFLKDTTIPKFTGFSNILSEIRLEGIISFEYAYHLAAFYVAQKPNICAFMRQRFSYIFVDEMQDMASHQCDLLERLFSCSDSSCPAYQRIGDKNQAIYSYEIFTGNVWVDRDKKLALKGSYRLSKPIAEVVKNFAEEIQDIDARGSASHLPIIVTYNEASTTHVIPWFAEKIKQLDLNKIPDATFHAIGWVKNPDKRLAIGNYWEPFEPQKDIHAKEYYDSLADYVESARMNRSVKSFKPIERLFMSAVLEVLRLEDVRQPNERYFTRTTLLAYLCDTHPKTFADLRLNLYRWCYATITGADIISSLKDFLNELLKTFGKNLTNSTNFITADSSITMRSEVNKAVNVGQINGVEITFGTVHSVKGQTHTATIYLETFNGGNGAKGSKAFDSGKLSKQFEGKPFDDKNTDYKVKNTRVAYVGMSRPTHLLCVAIHKDRLPKIDTTKWEVVDITTQEKVITEDKDKP